MFGISGGSFGGSGVKKYGVVADLPLTGVRPGTLAHVEQNLQGESALYLWNGTQNSGGWYRVATVNLAPNITTEVPESIALPNDGSSIGLTLNAKDPEGLPVTWSYQVSEGDPDGVAVISQDGSTFAITADPAALAAQTAGAFSLTFVASDGVSLSASTSAFTLSFAIGLTDPINSTLVAEIASPNQSIGATRGGIVGPDLYLLLSSEAGPVGALHDVSDPSSPVFIANLPSDAVFTGIPMQQVRGDGTGRFVVGDTSSDRILLLDAATPDSPVVIENTFYQYRGEIVGSNKSFAFVVGDQGVATMSFDTGLEAGSLSYSYPDIPTASKRPVSYPTDYDGDVFVFQIRNASTGDYRLQAVRIDVSGALTELSTFVGDTDVYFSGFDGRFAVARRIDSGAFQVWDYVNPAEPVKVFEEPTSQTGVANAFVWGAMQDGFFYVGSTSNSAVYAYSVSANGALSFLGTVPGSGPVGSALTAGSLANRALFFPSRDVDNKPVAKVFMNS